MLSTEYTKFKGTGFKIKIEKVNKKRRKISSHIKYQKM